jgi:hypothetical protein
MRLALPIADHGKGSGEGMRSLSQVSELGSCKEGSAGPDIQSHRLPTRAADEMRLGRQANGA